MSSFPFSGVNLALATPFDAAGRIDFARLEENIERYLAAGVRASCCRRVPGCMSTFRPRRRSR